MIESDQKQKGVMDNLWKNKPISLRPEDLDVSMTNVHAEEHAFTKSVRPVRHPSTVPPVGSQTHQNRGEAFTSVHKRLHSVMIIVHSRSEVTLQKSFPLPTKC